MTLMTNPGTTLSIGRLIASSLVIALLASTAVVAQDPPRASVRIEQPDLIVKASNIRFRPQKPEVGDEINFEIVVLNLGRADTRAKILCHLMRWDRTTISDSGSKTFEAGIRVNRSHIIRWKTRMPRGRRVEISVTATIVGGPADANESNNAVTVSVKHDDNDRGESDNTPPRETVRITPPSLPDLALTNDYISVSPARPIRYQEVTVWAGVRNIGNADANDVRVDFSVYVRGRLRARGIAEGRAPAHIYTTFRWGFVMPAGDDPVQIKVKVTAPNDSNKNNQQGEKWI